MGTQADDMRTHKDSLGPDRATRSLERDREVEVAAAKMKTTGRLVVFLLLSFARMVELDETGMYLHMANALGTWLALRGNNYTKAEDVGSFPKSNVLEGEPRKLGVENDADQI